MRYRVRRRRGSGNDLSNGGAIYLNRAAPSVRQEAAISPGHRKMSRDVPDGQTSHAALRSNWRWVMHRRAAPNAPSEASCSAAGPLRDEIDRRAVSTAVAESIRSQQPPPLPRSGAERQDAQLDAHQTFGVLFRIRISSVNGLNIYIRFAPDLFDRGLSRARCKSIVAQAGKRHSRPASTRHSYARG